MTFRAPMRRKWFHPFILCGLAAVAYAVIRIDLASNRKPDEDPSFGFSALMGVVCVGTFFCILISGSIWRQRVDVDDRGVRWKEGSDETDLKWEDIACLVQVGKNLGFVERKSARVVSLPFASRKLYAALTRRLGPLQPAEEEILFPSRRR